MDMWDNFWSKHQKTLWFVVGIICFLTAGLIVTVFYSPAKTQARISAPKAVEKSVTPALDTEKEAASVNTAAPDAGEPPSEWVLYITGAVRRPGVYTLPTESRLLRLVEAAGGLSVSADPAAINLAAVLADGLHVHVPEKGEEYSRVPDSRNSSAIGKPIDINRASVEELMTLKGVGPVLAGNIVEYRLKIGRFHSVEDLMRVKGIGRKKLEDLQDFVIIGP